MANERSGRTTRQMQEAPQGAVYIWASRQGVPCAREIARNAGRPDLIIVGPDWLRGERCHGMYYPDVILDHHTHETIGMDTLRLYFAAKARKVPALTNWTKTKDSKPVPWYKRLWARFLALFR